MTQASHTPDSAALLLARLDNLRRAECRAASARMVSVAGHLAGTPLNVIAGRAALIRGSQSPEAIEENVRRIEEQVERMSLRMRRLIDYFGLGAPSHERRTVGDVLTECRSLYAPVAELKGVRLSLDAGGVEPLRIEAEVAPLVLTTLLSLALQVATSGQAVSVSAAEQGANIVAFAFEVPTLNVPGNFARFEPPEHAWEYDPDTLEALWTCLGLARRLGGSLSVSKAAAGERTTVRFECGHEGPAR